jgi:CRISPR-associated endonuclease/helicase Cas3
MSATQPDLLQPAVELAGNQHEVQQLFKQCNRYRIVFKHGNSQSLDEFIENLIPRVADWLENQQRPLITLNTRASAKAVWQALQESFGERIPVYLISADLIPRDRLQKIAAIKTGEPCLVVSTQTIEAGVDIDMDVVIRDFAPLDALIQIAGRCNRNSKKGEYGGYIEIVSLVSKNGKEYTEYVYDKTILVTAREALSEFEEMTEDEILPLIDKYFSLLRSRKDTGKDLTHHFAYWEEMENVHRILRPESGEQIGFLVIDDEEGQQLITQLQQAFAVEDRWKKRRALQALASDLNKRTVTVYDRKDFYPDEYIDSRYLDLFKKYGYAVLKKKYYDIYQGITLPLDEDDRAVCII